jgi:hypothetical protein
VRCCNIRGVTPDQPDALTDRNSSPRLPLEATAAQVLLTVPAPQEVLPVARSHHQRPEQPVTPRARLGRVKSPLRENFCRALRVVLFMRPINEAHVAEPGLAVVEVVAADDETALAVHDSSGHAPDADPARSWPATRPDAAFVALAALEGRARGAVFSCPVHAALAASGCNRRQPPTPTTPPTDLPWSGPWSG